MFLPPNSLAQKPTLETVKAAIQTALSPDSSINRKPASDWLEALKNSQYAWEICNQLLMAQESIEISYTAAHMLRQKISRNFNELPLEHYASLKDLIVNYLKSTEDYAVQGQLTMAIADLTILLPSWQNPIEDLANQLDLQVSLRSIPVTDLSLIHRSLQNRLVFSYIMTHMCDLNHRHSERPCRVGAKRREEYEDYLISKCGQVITWWLNSVSEMDELKARLQTSGQLTSHLLDSNQVIKISENPVNKILENIDKLVGQIYLCYSAWLRIFDEENVNQSMPLVDGAFQHLNNLNCPSDLHKYAVEVISATTEFCDGNRTLDYLVNHLMERAYTLEQTFKQSIASEDMDRSRNISKTFTCIGEIACLTHVVEKRDFKIVELLLSCLNHYDFEIVGETFAFWWALLETLQNNLKQGEYDPFLVYINEFIMRVVKLCQFDPDEDSVVAKDQDIHEFREQTCDIITNFMYITSFESIFNSSQVMDNFRAETTWEKVEAYLFLLSCLVRMMTREENNHRMQIFNCILTQQTRSTDLQTLMSTKQVSIKVGLAHDEIHPQVVATTLKIIGSLENFLADYPDYLAIAINYILTSISSPTYRVQLIEYAVAALSQIMEFNARRHFSSCTDLMTIIGDLCKSMDQFNETACKDILKCGVHIADAIQDINMKDQFITGLVGSNLSYLKMALSGAGSGDSNANIPVDQNANNDPITHIDRLSVIFAQASIHPSIVPELKNFITLIDIELWPVIVQVLQTHSASREPLIERTCRLLRYIIRCIKPEWMIQRVAELIINLYKSYPQNSSPLYICSILVDEFANRSEEINQGLFAMLEIFCDLTFSLLEMNNSSGGSSGGGGGGGLSMDESSTGLATKSLLNMRSYPETIDDMMRLFNRFLKKCPKEFLCCKALNSIIELSITSLRIDHPDANANVCKFVASFIELGRNVDTNPQLNSWIREVLGARMTQAVISACIFDIPPALINEEADILMTLYSFDKDLFGTWVEASISSLPRTNVQGIESVQPDQLEDLKRTIANAGTTKRMVNGLRGFARLYA